MLLKERTSTWEHQDFFPVRLANMPSHDALRQPLKNELGVWTDLLKKRAPRCASANNRKIYAAMIKALENKRFPECASEIVYHMKDTLADAYSTLPPKSSDKEWWNALFRAIKSTVW